MDTEDYADLSAPITVREQPEQRREQEPSARAPLVTRALLWVTLAICLALLVATASETWAHIGLERQAAQTRAQNAAIQQDTTQTRRETEEAQSPDTIEREARAWGYVRPGDTPVIIIPTSGR